MSRRRVVALALVVVGVAVLAAVLVTSGEDDPSPSTSPPVLLVPGYGGSTTDLLTLADALETEGREPVLVELADNGTSDLREQADLVDAAARSAMEESGADSVDVVGFSAGGIVARLWVADDGAEVAHRVVTLATPNHGTDLVLQASDCPDACVQLGTGSDVMTELNAADETPDGPQWVTIWTTDDQAVLPPESARLEGALDFTVQSVCDGIAVGHTDMVRNSAVVAMVTAVLAGAEPTAPDESVC